MRERIRKRKIYNKGDRKKREKERERLREKKKNERKIVKDI